MQYIIDGYNLLFRFLNQEEKLAKSRQSMIQSLNKKIQLVELDILIVFDSSFRMDESHKSRFNHLEIQFTSRGITADDWIIEAVKRTPHPEKITVVTSDKLLKKVVTQLGAKGETVEAFLTLLNRRYQNKLKSKPKKVLPVSPIKKPASKTTPEGSFDYYLKTFEENFNTIEKPKKIEKLKIKPKKHLIPKEVSKEKLYGSEIERWQDLFENPQQ